MGSDNRRTAFFYGTLMAPQVLHRVCHGTSDPNNAIVKSSNLRTSDAILHGFRRHRVREADYPAIIPAADDGTVRGTCVTGLTDADIWRLDIFEGDEYRRDKVVARILTTAGDAETGAGNVEGESIEAETYVWIAGEHRLEDSEWDFAEFQREKMRFWVGAEGADEYAEVDAAVAASQTPNPPVDGTGGRGFNGHISNALLEERLREIDRSSV